MEPESKSAGTLLQQEPGQQSRHCSAANERKVAQTKYVSHSEGGKFRARNKWPVTPYRVTSAEGEPFAIEVKGRVAWALDRLRDAGQRGVTPQTEPGPRWSAYVHVLRELGVEIETIREGHGEPFPGHHGRYVLRSTVRRAAQ